MSEKQQIIQSVGGKQDLPAPASASQPISPLRQRLRKIRRIALFATLGYLAVQTFDRYSSSQKSSVNSVSTELGDANLQGYVNAVFTKGRDAVFAGMPNVHDNKHKHNKDKHGKHHHSGKHGHPKWISPKAAEEIFLSVPNNDSCRAASRRYTAYAHPAGSGYDFLSAVNLKGEWEKELGIPASGPADHLYDAGSHASQARVKDGMSKMGVWVDTYYPVMNTPVSSSITLLSDPPFHAKLREDIVEGDPDSVLRDEVRVFHGLSISGDVTGKYVYVSYGQKKDFDLLQSKGVDFTGKIAIVKYGMVFRGLKVKAAQEAGAIGCIIFTDPGDDGDITEENGYEVYPNGPARQPSSVQRGSVQFLSKYPGDPTTPGEPAYKNASRIQGGNYPSIPSLPMSYEDAIPILQALEGKGIAASELGPGWVGGLGYHGVEYFTGPSDIDLHLINEVNTRVMPIWNTMATIPGHITDEVVIVGNHRDAWVLGGSDPNSGTASQFEMIRGLGALVKKGWKPLRTIMLASWDAEEYGLIGSTEWAEDFGSWIEANTAAYFNLDSSVAGSVFDAAASPSLADLLKGAAKDVMTSADPSRSVWSTHQDANARSMTVEEDLETQFSGGSGVDALGSGSDFTPFLQRYGIASGNIGYAPGPKDSVYHYHSIYDSFTWQDKFADPGFHKHTDIGKMLGLISLRLADSLILPINTTQYTRDLGYYLAKVDHLASRLNVTQDLSLKSLGEAITKVHKTSIKLDEAKHEVLEKLRKALPKPAHCQRGLLAKIKRVWLKVKRVLTGKKRPHNHESAASRMEIYEEPDLVERLVELTNPAKHGSHHEVGSHHAERSVKKHGHHMPSKGKMEELKKIMKEIRDINLKLKGFEAGFISEAGLKEREWYRHKGTAPGKWLGYGATTFPALTEALTIDHSVEMAQTESGELAQMINAMADRLMA